MSALLKALIIGQPCAYSLVHNWLFDFDDVRPATLCLELVKLMLAHDLMESFFVNAPSILEALSKLFVISFSSESSTYEGETNLDPIL